MPELYACYMRLSTGMYIVYLHSQHAVTYPSCLYEYDNTTE